MSPVNGTSTAPVPVIIGLGDPVMDILARVTPEWLTSVTSEPGGCIPIPPSEMAELLAKAAAQSELIRIPGGSAANVVKGVANIAGPSAACKFVGMVGKDGTGAEYSSKLAKQGVEPLLLESSSGAPSACAVCLVTPDGQRTMRTCLGASLELQSSTQLSADWAHGCKLLHAEGYCLYRPQLAREMMTLARQRGATVSIDLASFELVRRCRDSLVALLQDGLIDLIFANEEEAITLCTELGLAPATASAEVQVEAAQSYLLRHAKVAVTSLGARGCVARGSDGEVGASPACRVQVVDTIGAGDFFTAGFLTAYLRGGNLQQCCAAGCASGCEAVQATGAELPPAAFARLQRSLTSILETTNTAASTGTATATATATAGASSAQPSLPAVLQNTAVLQSTATAAAAATAATAGTAPAGAMALSLA